MKQQMFEREIHVLRDTFRRLMRRHAHTNLIKLIGKTHPADLAALFRYFDGVEQAELFSLMGPNEKTGDFLTELDESTIRRLMSGVSPEQIVEFIEPISSSDQAEILNALSDEQAHDVFELLKKEEVEELEEIMAYPDDSAGSLMYTDVFTLHEDTTAKNAIAALQHQEEAEMVFYLYVTNDDDQLTGIISLRDLVTTNPNTLLKNIMTRNIHSVFPEMDQEDVAQIVSQYNYLAVPVIEQDSHLLGIVTVDDVVDVIREEATEDFLQMAGVGKDREILLKSTWKNAKSRLPWLFASWVGGIAAATIIGLYENLLQSTLALAAFIPVVIGMGGNIGTQTSTIIVRGLATGRVNLGNNFKVLFKEIRVGMILGVLYGILLGLFALTQFVDIEPSLGIIVGLSISTSMMIATTIGAFVPLFLNKLDIDPAIATGPFVTTSIDIIGVTLYFLIASLFLPLV
ncbi:MAG: magnesium transporter [Fidelibacterota bacterium]